ncbi:MAG: dTDP-4-amino-4,6-dideoxygalactose transaminase [bacterium]
MDYRIPFNRPFIVGKELFNVAQAVTRGRIAADGIFTRLCSRFLEERLGIHKVLLTPSCTAALEMAALLCGLAEDDEVILPSFTFVSTASAIVRTGARPVFVDIRPDTLNLDETLLKAAITRQTKMILPVHYAGVSCQMDVIMATAAEHGIRVVEDAAQAVHSYYKDRAAGSIGHLAAFSFHETKNYTCGEGGALCINEESFVELAEILRDKGTNRQRFLRGQVDKYTWVEVGSSYVPSEICTAFLWGQLEHFDAIAQRRHAIFSFYEELLKPLEERGLLRLPCVPASCQHNAHMFYVLLPSQRARDGLIEHLRERSILAVFHYVPLHSSPVGRRYGYDSGDFPVCEDVSARLVRLPFYYELNREDQVEIAHEISAFLAGPGKS